jgi:hypothetical protein
MTLKSAYRCLKGTGANIRLIPGDVFQGLTRVANELPNLDVIVLGARQPDHALRRAWFYFPRMLKPETVIFREEFGEPGADRGVQIVPQAEIRALASIDRRRAA